MSIDISKCKVINLKDTLAEDDKRKNLWRVECVDEVGYNIDVEAKDSAEALKIAAEHISTVTDTAEDNLGA